MLSYIKNKIRPYYTRAKFRGAYIALSAKVSQDSRLGKDVRVLENAKIGSSSIGDFCYIGVGSELTLTTIGRFGSIGGDVVCGLGIHPVNFVSTYPGFYSRRASGSKWFGTEHEVAENLPVQIGADVWIGTRAIILGGINVGHGAVIAAGAIVTKDVPDYAIVAGVPAKVIRYRFDEPVIMELLASCWWELPEEDLRTLAAYINDPMQFLEQLEKRKESQKIK